MNILIITTYYPPDTGIAAVRPYMLAKYLTEFGHKVTVLRSGEFYNSASDFFDMDIPVRVISYLGPDSPAECYARGELKTIPVVESKSRIGFLPEVIRKPVAWLFNTCMRPIRFKQWQEGFAHKTEKQKAVLDSLRDEHFDVVFSSFGEQENIAAGQYAKELFQCKLIQDFRDPLARTLFYGKKHLRYLKKIQDDAIARADGVTVVSEDLRQEMMKGIDAATPSITLYNGYEPSTTQSEAVVASGVFSICYTGAVYGKHDDFTPLLRALVQLSGEGRVDLSKVRLVIAGRGFDILLETAQELGIIDIVDNRGYVSRAEAERIQNTSDLFLVLTWNRKDSQGILSGKFYEGIRAGKPILALITGDLPNSELNVLNEEYRYGFCYEACREKEQFDDLCEFLAKAYDEKMRFGKVCYEVNPRMEKKFRYDNIAKQLEDFIQTI